MFKYIGLLVLLISFNSFAESVFLSCEGDLRRYHKDKPGSDLFGYSGTLEVNIEKKYFALGDNFVFPLTFVSNTKLQTHQVMYKISRNHADLDRITGEFMGVWDLMEGKELRPKIYFSLKCKRAQRVI